MYLTKGQQKKINGINKNLRDTVMMQRKYIRSLLALTGYSINEKCCVCNRELDTIETNRTERLINGCVDWVMDHGKFYCVDCYYDQES